MDWLFRGLWAGIAAATLAAGATGGCSDDTGTGGGCADELDAKGCFDMTCFTPAQGTVSFKTDVLPVLEQSCSLSASCHGSPSSPETAAGYQPYLGEVDPATTPSDVALIFSTNVGQASHRAPGMMIVDPGKPETSFLMHKVDGDLGCADLGCTGGDCGTGMPQGSDPMARERRDLIRDWILQGAKNN